MALTTLAGVISGLRPQINVIKAGASGSAGRHMSPWYASTSPPAATANSSGVSGAALTNPVTGGLPWVSPGSGETVVARTNIRANTTGTTAQQSEVILIDRLWHNSGINATLTTSQTITSAAFPARDVNQSTNGDGVLLALEVSTAATVGTPTITVTYTNQAGTGSRTATNIVSTTATSGVGSFYILSLQAGDTGVQSVQSYIQSVGWTSAVVHLVAFRVIAFMPCFNMNNASMPMRKSVMEEDVIQHAAPRVFDGSVLQTIGTAQSTSSLQTFGQIILASG